MPPLPSLAVRRYRFLQELKVALGAAPTRALVEQVALAYDVFVRAIVVAGHQRLAPDTRHDLFPETLSRSFRYSCRHRLMPRAALDLSSMRPDQTVEIKLRLDA
jgi:hypothetical protein